MENKEELKTADVVADSNGTSVLSDGTIKVDFSQIGKKPVIETPDLPATDIEIKPVITDIDIPEEKEKGTVDVPATLSSIIEEIIEDELPDGAAKPAIELQSEIKEAVLDSKASGIELPENIQKVIDFMAETNGTLEDYVKLNTDYSKLDNYSLLKEYYQNTKPHLDPEEIDFLMEENFSFDEDVDDERDIKKKKIAQKEELQKAKSHLETLKSKYYSEIKSGVKLAPEQQKAVEFFNRYNKDNEEATKLAEKQTQTFLQKTDQVFSEDFKGFDFQVGEKKYRFNVKNAPEVKSNQSDINNFIKKFLDEKNEMSDAKGYHKGLFTAMNADSVAQHFYEQGKADAIKDSTSRAKNIEMGVRGVHQDVKQVNGWQVRAVDTGAAESKLRIKTFKKI